MKEFRHFTEESDLEKCLSFPMRSLQLPIISLLFPLISLQSSKPELRVLSYMPRLIEFQMPKIMEFALLCRKEELDSMMFILDTLQREKSFVD